MRLEELRIGNYVSEHGGVSVVGLATFKHYDEMPSIMSAHIKPIPLTEEWLVKFGFELNMDSYYVKDNNVVYLEKEGVCKFLLRGDTVTINYVHQLQNIYFALMNQELKIYDISYREFMKRVNNMYIQNIVTPMDVFKFHAATGLLYESKFINLTYQEFIELKEQSL